MLTIILIMLIFMGAGLLQGLTGFGSSLLAMPLLTLFLDVKTAVPLCILNSLIITLYLSYKLRGFMEMRKILPIIIGSLPGIYLGATFLKSVDAEVIKLLLGLLIISYGLYSLMSEPRTRKVQSLWAYLAGFGAGFIGSAFSAGGPPVIIYTTLKGWSKDIIKATLTGFFLFASISIAAMHAATGLTDAGVLKYFAASALFTFVGVYAGSLLYGKIGRRGYIKVILITLIALGAIMVITALQKIFTS
jgi:uncharacterized membrane protein YfcA